MFKNKMSKMNLPLKHCMLYIVKMEMVMGWIFNSLDYHKKKKSTLLTTHVLFAIQVTRGGQ